MVRTQRRPLRIVLSPKRVVPRIGTARYDRAVTQSLTAERKALMSSDLRMVIWSARHLSLRFAPPREESAHLRDWKRPPSGETLAASFL